MTTDTPTDETPETPATNVRQIVLVLSPDAANDLLDEIEQSLKYGAPKGAAKAARLEGIRTELRTQIARTV